MPKLKKNLARNVTNRREFLGFTQAQLARKMGVTLRMVQKIEAAQVWPSSRMLVNLASALKCAPAQLIT